MPSHGCLVASESAGATPSGSVISTTSFSGRAFVPIRFDCPDFQSRDAGVGSSTSAISGSPPPAGSSSSTSAARHRPWSPPFCDGERFVCRFSFADARGVGSRPSEDEDSPAKMAGTHSGRGNTDPLRIEPERGQVCENGAKCPHSRFCAEVSQAPRAGFHVAIGSLTEQLLHVLDDHQRGAQFGYDAGDVEPQATPVALAQAFPLAGAGDVRAREPGCQHVYRLYRTPVDCGDVTEVRHVRVAAGEHLRRVWVVVREPRDLAAEHRAHGTIETAIARAETPDLHAASFPPGGGLRFIPGRGLACPLRGVQRPLWRRCEACRSLTAFCHALR